MHLSVIPISHIMISPANYQKLLHLSPSNVEYMKIISVVVGSLVVGAVYPLAAESTSTLIDLAEAHISTFGTPWSCLEPL